MNFKYLRSGPVWLATLSALLIARRNEPWPWVRIAAGAILTLAALGLADLEALRRGEQVEDLGGGLVGHAIATTLSSGIGISSAAIVLLVLAFMCGCVVTGLRPAQLARGCRWVASISWRMLVDWRHRR